MYRKSLTLTAVFFSVLAVAAVTNGAAPTAAHAKSQKKHTVASVQESGKKPTAFPVSMPPSFADADTNEDGEIEPSEAEAIGISFSALDLDSDGMITHSEYDIATAPYYSRAAIAPDHKE